MWAADVTYIPMACGFLYLVAIIDWASRAVLAWRLSNTNDASFCAAALEEALLRFGKPRIFNTDQGSTFTAEAFTSKLVTAGVEISMDGRGRFMDNIFIERLWRSIKYEEVHLKAYADGCRATSISTGHPTRKSRRSSSPPTSRPVNASASRRLSKLCLPSSERMCKSASLNPVALRSGIQEARLQRRTRPAASSDARTNTTHSSRKAASNRRCGNRGAALDRCDGRRFADCPKGFRAEGRKVAQWPHLPRIGRYSFGDFPPDGATSTKQRLRYSDGFFGVGTSEEGTRCTASERLLKSALARRCALVAQETVSSHRLQRRLPRKWLGFKVLCGLETVETVETGIGGN